MENQAEKTRIRMLITGSWSRRLSENGYFSSHYQRDVRLKVLDLQLDLANTISFLDGHYIVICDALWNKVQMTKSKCQIKSKTQMSKCCTFSINPGCIRKIPLNPPLQTGEGFGVPGLIEMLQNVFQNDQLFIFFPLCIFTSIGCLN